MLITGRSADARHRKAAGIIADYKRALGVTFGRVYDVTNQRGFRTSFDFGCTKSIYIDFVEISKAVHDPKLRALTSSKRYLRDPLLEPRNDYEILAFKFTLAHEVAHAFQSKFINGLEYAAAPPLFECHADLLSGFLMRKQIMDAQLRELLAFMEAYPSSMPADPKYPPGCVRGAAGKSGVLGVPRTDLEQFFRASLLQALTFTIGARFCEHERLQSFRCVGCLASRNSVPVLFSTNLSTSTTTHFVASAIAEYQKRMSSGSF